MIASRVVWLLRYLSILSPGTLPWKILDGSMLVEKQAWRKTVPIMPLVSLWDLSQLPPLIFARATASPYWSTTSW